MAEILSQSEIDDLLNALLSNEVVVQPEEEEVRAYDFRLPKKFSKEQMRTLRVIYESFARLVSNFLSSRLRCNVQIKVSSIEQVTYEEFTRSMPNPTVLGIFSMPPLEGNMLLEMNLELALQLIDLLFGGEGKSPVEPRELTQIEMGIMHKLVDEVIRYSKQAWSDFVEVNAALGSIETNPRISQILAPNEPVALITFTCNVEGIETFMHLCISYLSIEKIIDKLAIQYWFESKVKTSEDARAIIGRRLNLAEVELAVCLGKINITVGEFLELQKGDVLDLGRNVAESMELLVENIPKFKVHPGTIGKHKMGVQILQCIEKDVDDNG
jgi:flagellar motor switch protein FliM